jgi:hypothetical protein
MKIKLLVNLPVDPGHELTEGKVLDAEDCQTHTATGRYGPSRVPQGRQVGVLRHEAEEVIPDRE